MRPRATPTGLPALDDSGPAGWEPLDVQGAEQEFAAAGGSISEALSTVTGELTDRREGAARAIDNLEAIPQLLVPLHEITWHKLDHQAGFLLSRIDGTLTYNELLTIAGMPREQTLQILQRLLELELIGPTP